MGPMDTILIEMGEDLVITFEKSVAAPTPDAEGEAPPPHSHTKCWTCGRPGHFGWQCLSGPSVLHGSCFECGPAGHHAWACPIPSASPLYPPLDSSVCKIHNTPRGYLNNMKDEGGGWRCKPGSECTYRVWEACEPASFLGT